MGNSNEQYKYNHEILGYIKTNSENISLIDYSFSLNELCYLLRTDTRFKESWISNIKTSYQNINNSKESNLYIQYSLNLFLIQIKKFNNEYFKEEKKLILDILPKVESNLNSSDYSTMMTYKTDEAWVISNNCYVLLLSEEEEYLKYIEKNEELLIIYKEWLDDTMEIWQFEDNVDYPEELYQRPLKYIQGQLSYSNNKLSILTSKKIIELINKYKKPKQYTISDSDGYTNLRKEKNIQSSIVEQVKNGEKIEVLNNEGNWWLVKTKEGKQGYIYYDRIK